MVFPVTVRDIFKRVFLLSKNMSYTVIHRFTDWLRWQRMATVNYLLTIKARVRL